MAQVLDNVLEVRGLTTELATSAGTLRPVNDVTFTLRRGQTIGIVGESGSGKSMTALSILGLLPPQLKVRLSGKVLLNGTDLLTMGEAELRKVRGREISLIPQDPQTSLNPVFTVGNQLVEAMAVHGDGDRSGRFRRAIEVLRRVRIADPERRIRDYPHQMSGGMRQRVVGATAISCAPSVIIADEPTTALDVTVQKQYLNLLKELQRESGLGMIFITHDFGVVASICDYVMVMYAGSVVEQGAVGEIFDNPMHPYTRALLASISRMKDQPTRLPVIGGQPPALWDLPHGCSFAPRCAYADERCRQQVPPSTRRGAHRADCWNLEEKQCA